MVLGAVGRILLCDKMLQQGEFPYTSVIPFGLCVEQVGDEGDDRRKEKPGGFLSVLRRGLWSTEDGCVWTVHSTSIEQYVIIPHLLRFPFPSFQCIVCRCLLFSTYNTSRKHQPSRPVLCGVVRFNPWEGSAGLEELCSLESYWYLNLLMTRETVAVMPLFI